MGSDGEFKGTKPGVGAGIYLVLMVLIGSTTAAAARFAVRGGLPLGFLPLARFGIAGLCLIPFAVRGKLLYEMIRRDGWRLLAASAACVPINQAFFLAGTRYAPTSHVGIIYATCPLVVLLLAAALGQERLVPRRLVGVVASVLGVVVIGVGNWGRGGVVDLETLRGDLLLIGAVVAWGVYLTVNKPLVANFGALPTLAATFLVGAFLQLPVTLATFPGWAAFHALPASAWGGLLFMAVVVSVLGLACQNEALRRLDASQVATVGNASPVLTIIWGLWFFQEEVTTYLIFGAVLTLGGIAWASRPVAKSSAMADPLRLLAETSQPLPAPAR